MTMGANATRHRVWGTLLVVVTTAAACVMSNRPEVLVPGLNIVNDLAIPAQITYELNGVETPQNAKNLDRGTLSVQEARDFLFDIYDPGNQERCTRGTIRARGADNVVVALVPARQCLGKTVLLSAWPPPRP